MLSGGLRDDVVRLSEDQNVPATSGNLITITLHLFEVWNELARILEARQDIDEKTGFVHTEEQVRLGCGYLRRGGVESQNAVDSSRGILSLRDRAIFGLLDGVTNGVFRTRTFNLLGQTGLGVDICIQQSITGPDIAGLQRAQILSQGRAATSCLGDGHGF
jgi:hypothetical protein